jgi:hypothetical protein
MVRPRRASMRTCRASYRRTRLLTDVGSKTIASMGGMRVTVRLIATFSRI